MASDKKVSRMIEYTLHLVLSDADRVAIAKIRGLYGLQYDDEAVHLALQLAAKQRKPRKQKR
jgi:hypothetical protein